MSSIFRVLSDRTGSLGYAQNVYIMLETSTVGYLRILGVVVLRKILEDPSMYSLNIIIIIP